MPADLVARGLYRSGSAHPIAPAALTTGLRSRIQRRQPLNARRRKIGETSAGLAADEGTAALREGLTLRKNITFNFAGQPKGIAWLSFQPKGSISCGLRDRTYISPRFRDRIGLWNAYNRVEIEYRVPSNPNTLEACRWCSHYLPPATRNAFQRPA